MNETKQTSRHLTVVDMLCQAGSGQLVDTCVFPVDARGPRSGQALALQLAVQQLVPDASRFWSKVDRRADGCWTWTSQRDASGYGLFWIGGRTRRAHRIAFLLGGGTLTEGFCVLHRCDNPPCVRPDHLFLGTQRDNLRDAVRKGRRHPALYHLGHFKAHPNQPTRTTPAPGLV